MKKVCNTQRAGFNRLSKVSATNLAITPDQEQKCEQSEQNVASYYVMAHCPKINMNEKKQASSNSTSQHC